MNKTTSKSEALQKHESGQAERVTQRPAVAPRVDIYENKDELLLVADLPGVEKQDLRIHLDKDQLTIEGTRHEKVEGTMLGGEFREVDFQRAFLVPQGIDIDKIAADLKRGVLYLHLPKSDAVRPRQITVKAG